MNAPLVVGDLTVDFGGLRALADVSLRVEEHQAVGLIGPNGAGKTTLFDSVLGLVPSVRGVVHLFGQDVTGWPVHKRARLGVGRTFQRLELFSSLTVTQNVIVALEASSSVGGLASELLRRPASIHVRRRAEERAVELLSLLGLAGYASTRAGDLPIGLARALELARVLAGDPKLLMLDEPSSGLNNEETAALGERLRDLTRRHGMSLLVVEHDMDFVLGLVDHVYVLDFGKVIAAGSPQEIRSDATVQAAYLGEDIEV